MEEFNYQIIILDSPAGTGCPVIAAVKDTDFAVLVTEPTPSGLADLKRILTVVDYFQIPYGVVINKWDINQSLGKRIEKESNDRILGRSPMIKEFFKPLLA